MRNGNPKKLGLIIESENIIAVEVDISKKTPLVTNYSKIMLEEGIVEDGCVILNQEAFQEAVRRLLASGIGGAIHGKDILIAIPEEKIFSHQVVIPKEKLKDVEYIKEEARDYIPIELNEAVFDYKISSEDSNARTVTLNFIAAQSSIIEPIINALKKVKLNVIGVGINVNCLIRSFSNELSGKEGDMMIVNMDMERDLLAVYTSDSNIYKLILKNNRQQHIEKIKAILSLPTKKEVQEALLNLKQGEGLTPTQKEDLKTSMNEYINELLTKAKQLINIANTNEAINVGTIYLTGILSGLPGIKEALQSAFPDAQIATKLEFMDIPAEIENDALEGIGLCIKESIHDEKHNFNLLPESKKIELSLKRVAPTMKIVSVLSMILFVLLTGKLSISAAKNYLDYRISSQEVVILNDQALNPYITEVAKKKRDAETTQSQILSVLDDSMPIFEIIQEIDTYNKNGVSLTNIKYSDLETEGIAQLTLRAKALSRNETEKFVSALEAKDLYSLVISPLSNLIGKGERFINLTLMVDKRYVIDNLYSSENRLSASAPEIPSAFQSEPELAELPEEKSANKLTDTTEELNLQNDETVKAEDIVPNIEANKNE